MAEENDIKTESAAPRRRKKKRGVSPVLFALVLLIALSALFSAAYFYLRTDTLIREKEALEKQIAEEYIHINELAAYEEQSRKAGEEEGIATGRQEVLDYFTGQMSEGTRGPLDSLRSLMPDQIILGYAGRYIFQPVDDSLPKNNFAREDFETDEDGFVRYTGPDTALETMRGVDVSAYQGVIDWARVKAAGIDFAFIRVGFRGWGRSGSYNDDEYFDRNVRGAYENGIAVGVYWVTHAVNEQEAAEEAAYVLDKIRPYRSMISFPVVYDLEVPEDPENRIRDLTVEQHTANARVFLDTIRSAGYTPMFYGNLTNFVVMVDPATIMEYPVWYAWYSVPLYFPYRFHIWQYTSTGRVDGIRGDVDLNILVLREW